MRSRSLLLWVVAALAVAALIAAPTAHVAHAAPGGGVVISAVYTGGGRTGAIYTHDYIEIFNAGATPADITGWSVQYRHSQTGSTWQKTQISAATTLQPGQYYLIQADNDGPVTPVGSALPAADNTNDANMRAAGNVVVALMSTLDTIIGDDPHADLNTQDDIEDLFGAGDPAAVPSTVPSVFEGAARTGTLDSTTAWFRDGNGCTDTDNNLDDFTAGPVTGMPRNTATTFAPCAPTADLTVDISGAPTPIVTGNATTFSVGVDNVGTAPANSVVITVDLTGTAVAGSTVGTPSAVECVPASTTITCNVASIPAGGAFDFTFTVTPVNSGTIVADAEVAATPADNTSNNSDQATVTVNDPVVTTADLTVSIADAPDPVVFGNPVTYTVTVANSGNAAANTSELTVALSGTAFPDAVGALTAGCTYNSPNVECILGIIAPAANKVVSFTVTPAAAGDIAATATVAADAPETDTNNTDSETTIVTAPVPTVGAFNLARPDEGQILRTTTTTFQWTESAGATSYEVYVSYLSTNTRLGETYTVTKNSDVCVAGVCSVASTELVANLEQGTYSWTVLAVNGSAETEASDGPNLFTVVLDGIELISNGGLEEGSVGWTFSSTAAKVKCKAAWGNNSDCALKLRPGTKAHQRGVMGPILAATDTDIGDVLQVSAAVRTTKAAKQRVVMVVVKYVNLSAGAAGNGKDKFKLFVEQATTGYETFSANFVLAGEIQSGRVVVANTLTAGTLRVDDVSVVLMPLGTAPRAEAPAAAPASADGVLPVPAAPDNFRGSN